MGVITRRPYRIEGQHVRHYLFMSRQALSLVTTYATFCHRKLPMSRQLYQTKSYLWSFFLSNMALSLTTAVLSCRRTEPLRAQLVAGECSLILSCFTMYLSSLRERPLLSSTTYCRSRWKEHIPASLILSFFISHGSQSPPCPLSALLVLLLVGVVCSHTRVEREFCHDEHKIFL